MDKRTATTTTTTTMSVFGLYSNKGVYCQFSPGWVCPSEIRDDRYKRDILRATPHPLHHAQRNLLAQRVHRDDQVGIVVLDHRSKPVVALNVAQLLRTVTFYRGRWQVHDVLRRR